MIPEALLPAKAPEGRPCQEGLVPTFVSTSGLWRTPGLPSSFVTTRQRLQGLVS